MNTWSLAFDAVIAVLLVATICYAAVLNRKLSALRSAKEEMASLLRSFSEATAKADAGLDAIRRTATNSGKELKELQDQVAKASVLSEDLRFLIERAGLSADKVEASIAKDRGAALAKAGPSLARERPVSGAVKPAHLLGKAQDVPRPSPRMPVGKSPAATRPQPRTAEPEPQVSAEQVALIKALDGVR